MKKQKLVVVGNGMAGMRAVEELLKLAPDLYDITVFGAEPHPNYNRILLSPVLAGEMTINDIILNPLGWYADNGIRLHVGKTVTKIDRTARKVVASDGTEEEYDRLLLATGSTPFMLPVPGNDLPGVISYRDIKDTDEMIATAATHKHAVVIGGGLLGLEAANGLKLRGMDVTVVHLMPWLMERQLDKVAADMLKASLEARGLKFLLEKQTEALLGGESGRVAAIRFKPAPGYDPGDGLEIPADLVVMAAGIRPNTALAESARLHCNRGIVVNDTMQTYDPRIYAVGECVAHRGIAYGLVAPLFEQAKVCANHLANFGIARYTGSVTSTKLKVTGIDLFSAGNFMGGAGTDEIVLNDAAGGVYKKLVVKNDTLVGAVLYGDTADGGWYFQLVKDGQNIRETARPAAVRPEPCRRRRPCRRLQGRLDARRGRGLRLQRRLQGRHRQGDQEPGPVHARRRAQAHQGLQLLRFLHRPGRADPRLDHRRRLHAGGYQGKAAVRLHRPFAWRGAPDHPRTPPAHHPRHHALHGLEDARRLRLLSPGAQLLPDLDLAGRGQGRSAVALRQ
jgi:nitrite reductase (NADH) large subunit